MGAVFRVSPSYNVTQQLWSELERADRLTGWRTDRTKYWVRLTLWLKITISLPDSYNGCCNNFLPFFESRHNTLLSTPFIWGPVLCHTITCFGSPELYEKSENYLHYSIRIYFKIQWWHCLSALFWRGWKSTTSLKVQKKLIGNIEYNDLVKCWMNKCPTFLISQRLKEREREGCSLHTSFCF